MKAVFPALLVFVCTVASAETEIENTTRCAVLGEVAFLAATERDAGLNQKQTLDFVRNSMEFGLNRPLDASETQWVKYVFQHPATIPMFAKGYATGICKGIHWGIQIGIKLMQKK